jgi:hypothetical protein
MSRVDDEVRGHLAKQENVAAFTLIREWPFQPGTPGEVRSAAKATHPKRARKLIHT